MILIEWISLRLIDGLLVFQVFRVDWNDEPNRRTRSRAIIKLTPVRGRRRSNASRTRGSAIILENEMQRGAWILKWFFVFLFRGVFKHAKRVGRRLADLLELSAYKSAANVSCSIGQLAWIRGSFQLRFYSWFEWFLTTSSFDHDSIIKLIWSEIETLRQ